VSTNPVSWNVTSSPLARAIGTNGRYNGPPSRKEEGSSLYGYSHGSGGGSAKADVERLVDKRDATAEHDVIEVFGLLEEAAR